MLNVLEHIEDDKAALEQTFRILRPGGIAVIEVPAGPHLYDTYDKALKHFRRYDLNDLTSKLRNVGFTVRRQSHLGFILYPAFAFAKRRNQRRQGLHEDPNTLVKRQVSATSSSRLVNYAVAFEKALGKQISFPIGIRCVVVGSKSA
jgi:SAM-dependent methyltransferase